MENSNKEIETRTFEQLMFDLRTQKNWTYLNIVEELYKLGVNVTEKDVKKWEFGLAYPDLDVIYKLSELFFISSEDFLNAKNNSFTKGYNTIHMTIIKWFCYFTGFTLTIGYIFFVLVIVFGAIGALIYFTEQFNLFKQLHG